MAEVSGSLLMKITTNDVPNFVVKGMKCQNYKGFYHQKFLPNVVSECPDSGREILKAF